MKYEEKRNKVRISPAHRLSFFCTQAGKQWQANKRTKSLLSSILKYEALVTAFLNRILSRGVKVYLYDSAHVGFNLIQSLNCMNNRLTVSFCKIHETGFDIQIRDRNDQRQG